MQQPSGRDVVAAAVRLAPRIRAAREEIESGGRLPSWLVQELTAADLLQLSLPASLGGPESHPMAAFEAIEALARADGSVGWCASIAASISLFAGGWLERDVGRALFGQPPDARIAGSIRAEGQAQIVPGGYQATGRWDFASGVQHANWLFCTCTLHEPSGPVLTRSGQPRVRTLLVPITSAAVVDTWSVIGMRGTGSHDFVVHEVFVPEAHSFSLGDPPQAAGRLYHPRLAMSCAWATTAGVALGIARGALDAFSAMAGEASSGSTAVLGQRPRVQSRVAEAEAIVGGARAFLRESLTSAWEAVGTEEQADPGPAIARARLAITHAMHESVRAVDGLFQVAGTNAVFRKHGLERCFRDVHVAVQHAAGQMTHMETAGKALLGERLREPGW